MENYLIIIIIVTFVAIGIIFTTKHFRGQGGCCSGGGSKPKKKKLSKILYQNNFTVEGMHCKHCKSKVEQIVNDMKGLSGKVNLKSKVLTVSYAVDVSDEQIINRLEQFGYKAVRVQ